MTVLDVGRALQFFFSAGSMEHPKHSTQEQLASIVSLYKSGEAVKEISRIVGLAERTVQKWIKRYREKRRRGNTNTRETFWEAVEDHTTHYKYHPAASGGQTTLVSKRNKRK